MKSLSLLVLLSVVATSSAVARGKTPVDLYTGYSGFALPADPVLPAHEVHPSLWFKTADLPALQKSLAADDFARTRWAAVQHLADLGQPVPAAPDARDATNDIHRYYGTMSMAARAHALVAVLTGDPAVRAAQLQRATELLMRAYDGPIFELDSSIKGSPVDEIYRGTWLQNYAAAYDCIQPSLTPAEDESIRARLGREAECVYENLHVWTPDSPHNHLSKPAWGLGSIALALSSHPHARAWLARAVEAANKNTRYNFSSDGLYREGSHYLIFSAVNFIPFLYHYRNVSGVDGFPEFQPVFEAMVETRNHRGWLPNIEDSYLKPTPTHLVAGAYRHARTRLHSSAPLDEILTWAYATCDFGPFDREKAGSGFNYTGSSWDYPLEIDELLTHDRTLRATAPDCPPNVFLAGGQTILRNAWTTGPAGQRYLLLHNIGVADNHNHDDQLSFIIEAEGQMMASDSGYSRGTYTGKERTHWYVTAPAHNTLTLDGQPADKTPSNKMGPPTRFADDHGLLAATGSADFPQGAHWDRTIIWIDGDYYVVADSVTGKAPESVASSYLHGGRGSLTRDDHAYTWTYREDDYGPAAQLHAWIAAPTATVVEKSGELTYIKGDYAEFPYLEITSADTSRPWLMLLKPAALNATARFDVETRDDANASALIVTTDHHRTLIAARSVDAPALQLDGVETDATLVVVRRDPTGKVLNHRITGGTYLRVNHQEVALE